ncbi:hypothetical protein DLM78_16405 [Leptospira stimsonii]|uniref:Uncharacterized protein n=1 Tax=Leptospira stimsonii TaxID=2202203 RepID=A0A8B3CR75_9LEPT|nr:hypothetical protein DLM78_16405 [Leptospira stimsonii]
MNATIVSKDKRKRRTSISISTSSLFQKLPKPSVSIEAKTTISAGVRTEMGNPFLKILILNYPKIRDSFGDRLERKPWFKIYYIAICKSVKRTLLIQIEKFVRNVFLQKEFRIFELVYGIFLSP